MQKSPYIVDASWLFQQLNQSQSEKIVVIDTRFSLSAPELGHAQYLSGHIPGAYYLDLNQDLSGPVQSHGGRHPLPNWAAFTKRLNQLGIHSTPPDGHTQVVIYDDSRFAFAARLWWMLRYLGHEKVAILNGGIKAWEQAGYPLSTQVPAAKRGSFRPDPQPDWIVDIETLRQRKDLPEVMVIDSRSPERFRGEVELIDPIAGSIPGAVNFFWQQNTTEAGQIKSTTQLSTQWANLGANLGLAKPLNGSSGNGSASPQEVIIYCGSGVTACVNLFALVVAGHPMYRLYLGGWSDWCSYLPTDLIGKCPN